MWCIPEVGSEFVACMEDILDLYAKPYDPCYPVVCFDETSKQLIHQTRPSIPPQPGYLERYDYEYKRNGTRNIFLFFQPRAGYRHLEVTEQRTKQDWAQCMKWLVDEAYPDATCVRVVLDNLNTHTYAALYDTFSPAEARRIRKRLELHYTPKHASWLNMAEIEFSVFARSAWKGYVRDEDALKANISQLEAERNRLCMTVNWRFSTADARVKLEHLYPTYSN